MCSGICAKQESQAFGNLNYHSQKHHLNSTVYLCLKSGNVIL